jgi:hypothetical protein
MLPVAVVALLGTVTPARADVGPPPSCPSGSHDEYMYGHHCIKDGNHIEQLPDGGWAEVGPGEPAVKPADPIAPLFPATPDMPVPSIDPGPPGNGPAPAPAAPVEVAPAAVGGGCGCDSGGGAGGFVALAAGLLVLGRRH